jgi:hypothetical protein
MGQAKRRRDQLGSLYGTPEGSNRKLPSLVDLAGLEPVDLLDATLCKGDKVEATRLLLDPNLKPFRRSFPPVPGFPGLAAVEVWGDGELAGVELIPHP